MKKYRIFLFLVMIALVGCSTLRTEEPLELKITTINSSLGAFEGDAAFQTFDYEIIVENVSAAEVDITYAEPVISEMVKERMKEADLKQTIDGTMKQNDFFTLKNIFIFKAADLTKEQIASIKIIEGVLLYTAEGESIFIKSEF